MVAACRALAYPHTTYLLDDGRRTEMEELARVAGAEYLTRPDNSHAKAGNIDADQALLRRQALLEIGGVATETIAEDFHTTIRLLRHGWSSRYHERSWSRAWPHTTSTATCCSATAGRAATSRSSASRVPPARP